MISVRRLLKKFSIRWTEYNFWFGYSEFFCTACTEVWTALHCTAQQYNTIHCTLHHTTPHHTTPHHTTPHHTTPHNTTLHYTTLHHTTLHHITLHHITPHHTTLYTTLPHATHSTPFALYYFTPDTRLSRTTTYSPTLSHTVPCSPPSIGIPWNSLSKTLFFSCSPKTNLQRQEPNKSRRINLNTWKMLRLSWWRTMAWELMMRF